MKIKLEVELLKRNKKRVHQRPRGMWEHVSESNPYACKCSNCRTRFIISRTKPWKWCPVCGARMKDRKNNE